MRSRLCLDTRLRGRDSRNYPGSGSGHFPCSGPGPGVGMRESVRSRSQELHNNDSMSGSGRWYDTIMTTNNERKMLSINDFDCQCVTCIGCDKFMLKREGKIFVFRWEILYEGLFVVFVFQQLRCVGLDKSFYMENILIIKWDDCVRGSAVRFMGISW